MRVRALAFFNMVPRRPDLSNDGFAGLFLKDQLLCSWRVPPLCLQMRAVFRPPASHRQGPWREREEKGNRSRNLRFMQGTVAALIASCSRDRALSAEDASDVNAQGSDIIVVKAASPDDSQHTSVAPMYRRFAANFIDIFIARFINLVFTLALKLASMQLGRPVSDDVAKKFGNLAQVSSSRALGRYKLCKLVRLLRTDSYYSSLAGHLLFDHPTRRPHRREWPNLRQKAPADSHRAGWATRPDVPSGLHEFKPRLLLSLQKM
jgi:hypothetical protein